MPKTLSQHKNTCVAFLSFSVVTGLSIVVTEFICLSSAFYVATEEGLSRQSSFAICLDHCRDRVKGVATVFFTFFFSNVATKKNLCRNRNAHSALSYACALLQLIAAGCDIVL